MVSKNDGPSPGRVIITYARGWQSLAAARSLGERGVEVIAADEYPLTPTSFSRYTVAGFRYPSPTGEPGAFLDALEKAIQKYKPAHPETPYVLMPIHKETYLIARHRERFEPHIRVPVPEIAHIERVHSKGRLAALAMELGIPIPKTWLPSSVEELEEKLPSMTMPVFIKLRESAAGVGILKLDDGAELLATFKTFVEKYRLRPGEYPIIQEAVPGDDYCVTTLFDRGTLVTAMTYRNLRAYPAEKGAGVLRETVVAPLMEKTAAELLGSMGWHGVAEIDFRWDGTPQGVTHLIEVNPRFWGGLIQAIESGWDYPWMLFRLAVDGHVEKTASGHYDVRTETPILALLATLQDMADDDDGMAALKQVWRDAGQELRTGSRRAGLVKLVSGLKEALDMKGRLREARRLLEDHRDNVYDVLSKQDPLPVLGILYPLAVFLRHGRINMELITSEGGPGEDHEGG